MKNNFKNYLRGNKVFMETIYIILLFFTYCRTGERIEVQIVYKYAF